MKNVANALKTIAIFQDIKSVIIIFPGVSLVKNVANDSKKMAFSENHKSMCLLMPKGSSVKNVVNDSKTILEDKSQWWSGCLTILR